MTSRREFLRLAALAGAGAALGGAACGSDSPKPKAATKSTTGKGKTLKIAQVAHFVPAYDQWFDKEYTQRWGDEHGVRVVVDHFSVDGLPAQAASEVAVGRGHDLFGSLSPASAFEDEVIDHAEIVKEVERQIGPMTPFIERGMLNPKTGKYYGFTDYWAPFPVVYRADLWADVGLPAGPSTWDDVLRAAPALKAAGHPVGVALSRCVDGNWGLESLLNAFGASVQDAEGRVVLNKPATVEAVRLAASTFRAGMNEDVFSWAADSNNRFIASGEGSMTLNPVSVNRAVEKQDPDLSAKLGLAASLAGPAQRLGASSANSTYVIWRFAENREPAEQFLVDLALNYREAFIRSEFYNLPAYPGAVPDLDQLLSADASQPAGKYTLLAHAAEWTTNVGHPGTTNAAIDEVFNQYLIPEMFAAAARGQLTPEEAVAAAEAKVKPIFEKWRAKGKI